MSDGWETRRSQENRGKYAPGGPLAGQERKEWAVAKLGVPGIVRWVEVDTAFHPGNYPKVSIAIVIAFELTSRRLLPSKQHFPPTKTSQLHHGPPSSVRPPVEPIVNTTFPLSPASLLLRYFPTSDTPCSLMVALSVSESSVTPSTLAPLMPRGL